MYTLIRDRYKQRKKQRIAENADGPEYRCYRDICGSKLEHEMSWHDIPRADLRLIQSFSVDSTKLMIIKIKNAMSFQIQ